MRNLRKSFHMLGLCLLFGTPALAPASASADHTFAQAQSGLNQVALSLEKALPPLVSSEDYRAASNTAFLLATARSQLDQTVAACAALAQSLEYYRKAISQETGERTHGKALGIEEASDGMAIVRAKFGCNRAHAA
jgi:hypothetical protein